MNLKKIKRLIELRNFCFLGHPKIKREALLHHTKGQDSEQWAKDYLELNAQILAFQAKYPELYEVDKTKYDGNDGKPKFPTGKPNLCFEADIPSAYDRLEDEKDGLIPKQ